MANLKSHTEDRQLWEDIKQGKETSFELLYNKYAKLLYPYGFQLTPDESIIKDALQEMFISLWEKKNQLSAVENVKFYLFRAFRNRLIRKSRTSSQTILMNLSELVAIDDESRIIKNQHLQERTIYLKHRINKLPARQKEVVSLKYFNNFSNREIADILGINYQSVSNLLSRAIKSLQQGYGENAEKKSSE